MANIILSRFFLDLRSANAYREDDLLSGNGTRSLPSLRGVQSLGGSLVIDHQARERSQNEDTDAGDEDEAGEPHSAVDTEARGTSSRGAVEEVS